ncbi:REP-associated tyrosine transposase [Pseudomonas sp. UBA2684]|uniref:REP-associated tyrosine transposase n=1 Tax=Pseudomonas sp. UBA2684 TaxID=1947311 RepID=UPI000E8CCA83|nr:transposase [Pseudomonas sp. UBA2684]HBX56095.1 transposase [Pseudomonas sp.]|tara:strand:- start:21955 stop:22455 length:501 start_codon:yes stop_codon:yes gene_type:complete
MDEHHSHRGHGPLLHRKSGHAALRKGRVSLGHTVYLITATTDKREPRFAYFPAACSAARCFEDRALLGESRMLAWVLMPDHAHWLLQLGDKDRLGDVVGRLKSASSRQANRLLDRQGPLWAKTFHDHALRAEDGLQAVARYIVANPRRAGLVKRIGDYPFWNAIWL